MTHNLEWLLKRGITSQAIEYFGLTAAPNPATGRGIGVKYLTAGTDGSIAARWKNSQTGKFKYAWGVGSEQHTQTNVFYNPVAHPLTCQQFAGATLHVTGGEVCTWSVISAYLRVGRPLPLVTNFFGDGVAAEAAIEFWSKNGIQQIKYYPDRDKTGLQSAISLVELCRLHNISIQVFRVPGNANSKNDLNDMLLKLRNYRQFVARFESLTAWSRRDYKRHTQKRHVKPKAMRSQRPYNSDTLSGEFVMQTVRAVRDIISRDNSRSRTHSHCPRPGHRDKHPSFRIIENPRNASYPVPVCTCPELRSSGGNKWDLLARELGLEEWEDFLARKKRERREAVS